MRTKHTNDEEESNRWETTLGYVIGSNEVLSE